MDPVLHDSLRLGDRLGSGGQGTVHMVLNAELNDRWPLAYKEYHPSVRDTLDLGALGAMVALTSELPGPAAQWLTSVTAWPTAIVHREGQVTGFLMRAVPAEYYFSFPGLDGTVTRKLATAEFLLNDDSFASSIGLHVDNRQRLWLLADLATTLSRLHEMGIAVGDLSPKNLLFKRATPGSGPGCFLIDCDAMRLHGRSVLPQAETPDWQVPDGEEKATPSSDAYKLALLAVRLFARDQTWRDPLVLPAAEPVLASLARDALLGPPASRPVPALWAMYCQHAANSPNLDLTPPHGGADQGKPKVKATATGTGKGKASTTTQARWAFAVGAVALLGVIVLVTRLAGGGNASLSSSSAPPPSTSAPASTYAVAVPTTEPPTEPLPTTPSSDPDDASTDLTPFTTSALLPDSFTDSNEVDYNLAAGGQQPCLASGQTKTVQAILQQYHCSRLMTGSYMDDDHHILVSVEVWALPDASTADQVEIAFQQAQDKGDFYAGDFGMWCPLSGPGAICDESGFSEAAKYGYYTADARYFINTDAMWTNLSQDTSSQYEDQLNAAAKAAVDAAGPQNYPANDCGSSGC